MSNTTRASRELWLAAIAAMEGDSEEEALAALKKTRAPCPDQELYEAESAALSAFKQGWTRVAKALGSSRALGEDPERLLSAAAEAGRDDVFRMVAHFADPHDLLREAYRIGSDDWEEEEEGDGERHPMQALAIDLAREKWVQEWERALGEGWRGQWEARPRGRYEEACEHWGAPPWSAASPRPLPINGAPLHSSIPWAIHVPQHGTALDLPKEVLQVWGFEFALWREALRKSPPADPLWEDKLDQAEASHAWAANALPKIAKAMEEVCSGRPTPKQIKALEDVARECEQAKAGRWVPVMLAWANHAPYDDRREAALAPLAKVAILDEQNVGWLAAHWHYGSFNARVARIGVGLARAGQASPGAVAILSARIHDLAQDPRSVEDLSGSHFRDQIQALSQEMAAMGERLDIGAAVGASSAESPKGPRL